MRRITTLSQLYELVIKKKAITCGHCFKRVPAAFVINMPGNVLFNMFQIGMYEYKKEKVKSGQA